MDLPQTSKDRGYLAELIFALEAKRREYTILTTGGDNAAFDVVLYDVKSGKFTKVQVKSCLQKEPNRNRYCFTIKQGGPNMHRSYDAKDVDVMALYAFDANVWYFLPINVVAQQKTIKIDSTDRYSHYKDNWEVFK